MSCVTTLKGKGLRLTPQRILITDVIHDDGGHLTASEIVRRVQTKMPGVNKSTIYRTLEILEEAGCVYKSEMEDEFIYHHDEEGHHHHLACLSCGKTVDCDESVFTSMRKSLMNKYGFDASMEHGTVNGICAECRSRKS